MLLHWGPDFPHSSSCHMNCLCLSDSPEKTKKQKTKQGLIHLNKRAVQPAMAALRTDSEEWGPQRDRVQTEAKRGSLHFRQILLWTKTRQDKQTVHVPDAQLWIQLRKILFMQGETVFKRDRQSAKQMGSIIMRGKERVAVWGVWFLCGYCL